MARKKRQGPSPAELRRLERLPQRFDAWQVDAREVDAEVRQGDELIRPWLVLVASRDEGFILGFHVVPDEPSPAEVWQTLARAMAQPAAGEPHRPTEVLLARPDWAEELEPYLEKVGVRCAVSEEGALQLDELFENLAGALARPADPGLLDVPGVTPEAVASFFDAAAGFYRQAPWRKVGERPIKIDCPRFESGPWYAVLMGQAGLTAGLVLYDSLETLQRIQTGELSDEEGARLTAALAVVFGSEDELPEADAQAAREHGWRVAGEDAWPVVYRKEPGLTMRPPLAWELELLEACLRVVPEFARQKTRRTAPFAAEAPTASGGLPLMLSWAEG
jgi:hypothetical protein